MSPKIASRGDCSQGPPTDGASVVSANELILADEKSFYVALIGNGCHAQESVNVDRVELDTGATRDISKV